MMALLSKFIMTKFLFIRIITTLVMINTDSIMVKNLFRNFILNEDSLKRSFENALENERSFESINKSRRGIESIEKM